MIKSGKQSGGGRKPHRSIIQASVVLLLVICGLAVWAWVDLKQEGIFDDAPPLSAQPISTSQLTVAIIPLIPSPRVSEILLRKDTPRQQIEDSLMGDTGINEAIEGMTVAYPFTYVIAEPREIPDDCFNAEVRQYMAGDVLSWLMKTHDPRHFRSVGVMGADIAKPGYNFLFGLANLGGACCVSSCHRMGAGMGVTKELARDRWHHILRHEFGHTLGLQHNEDWSSVMAYGDSLMQLDQQGCELTGQDWDTLDELYPYLRWK